MLLARVLRCGGGFGSGPCGPSRTARALGEAFGLYEPAQPRLERAIRQAGAALAVIDPIMAFLSGEVNSNRDQDVRAALTPLKRMAERTGCAVVLVRHLNKTPGGNPLYRGGGSIGIIGAARSGLVVGKHPDDDELRVLAGQKNNLSLPPESLAYRIESAENGAARIVYEGISEATAGQILRVPVDEEEKSARSEAREFLLSELKGHPMAMRTVERNAREAGIKSRTLTRAKQDLGVKSSKESDGSWTWSLPDKEGQGCQASIVGNVGHLGTLPVNKPNTDRNQDGQAEDVGILRNGRNPAYLSEDGQGGQDGQANKRPSCIHGYQDGKGCYLCDPNHPYRLKEGAMG